MLITLCDSVLTGIVLTIISFTVSFNSINFLVDFSQYTKFVKILHINIENELYAFTISFSIFILICI